MNSPDALLPETAQAIGQRVVNLSNWFDSMRGNGGYGGPVAHWWQNCLQFTGAGLDWRYEGIILGYLTLHEKTGDDNWLKKARQAGDDLVHGTLPNSNFRNSSFELNPYSGGTPHEAACDLGLLHLAAALKKTENSAWATYQNTAERNLRAYYIERLWDADAGAFRDNPDIPSFVPNKAATLIEALFKLANLTGDEKLVEQIIMPTLNTLLAHQIPGGQYKGAIYQFSAGGRFRAWFFPLYVARCVPALLAGYEWSGDQRYLDAALDAMRFVMRWRYDDGSFPQVIYARNRASRYPQWIAATADILRILALLKPYGFQVEAEPTLTWLLDGQERTGSFRTAKGFASQISQVEPEILPEFRDLLPVCGWNDKVLRYLAGILPDNIKLNMRTYEEKALRTSCSVRGKRANYFENNEGLKLTRDEMVIYLWRKGTPWAEVCAPELWWK